MEISYIKKIFFFILFSSINVFIFSEDFLEVLKIPVLEFEKKYDLLETVSIDIAGHYTIQVNEIDKEKILIYNIEILNANSIYLLFYQPFLFSTTYCIVAVFETGTTDLKEYISFELNGESELKIFEEKVYNSFNSY